MHDGRLSGAGLCLASLLPLLLAGISAGDLRAQQLASRVSQHGITWTFDRPVPTGRFVNGDHWVQGPVTVTSVSPAPANDRHGSVLNPSCGMGTGRVQGYDGRIANYDPQQCARFPLGLQPGDALISTISVTGAQQKHIYRPETQGIVSMAWLQTCAILSCVDQAPAADAFRPAYAGPEREHRASQIRWDKLPRVPVLPSSPDPRAFARMFERPWLDHLAGWIGRMLHPYENMPDYGRDIALCSGEGALTLLQDHPRAHLEPLMIHYLQMGIDMGGLALAGHAWGADGGHGNGRKWPILFAGIMLDDPRVLQLKTEFSEDRQTSPSRGWNGAPASFDMYGKGSHEAQRPDLWDATEQKYEVYRRCCTSAAFVAHALAAHLMQATEYWGHPAFFLYVERWMTPMHPDDHAAIRKVIGSSADTYKHGGTGITLAGDMWARYRSRYQPRGIVSLGPGSSEPIRIHVVDVPLRGQPYALHFANSPAKIGFAIFGQPHPKKPGPPIPVYLAPPYLTVPFTANASGKFSFSLGLPRQRGLVFGVQGFWWDGQRFESSPAYALRPQ